MDPVSISTAATDTDSAHQAAALIDAVVTPDISADIDFDYEAGDALLKELLVFPNTQENPDPQPKEKEGPAVVPSSPPGSGADPPKKDPQSAPAANPSESEESSSLVSALAEKQALIQTLTLANQKMRRRIRETKRIYSMYMEQRSEIQMLRDKVAVAEAELDLAKAKAELLVSEANVNPTVLSPNPASCVAAQKKNPTGMGDTGKCKPASKPIEPLKVAELKSISPDDFGGDTLADIFNLPHLADDLNSSADSHLAVHLDSNVIGADGMLDLSLTGLGEEYHTSGDSATGEMSVVAIPALQVSSVTGSDSTKNGTGDSRKSPTGIMAPPTTQKNTALTATLLKSPDAVKDLSINRADRGSAEKRPRDAVVVRGGPVPKMSKLERVSCSTGMGERSPA